jgi:hypothetical protein
MINPYMRSHPFWGLHAPLSTLINAGLILMASVRTAYAILILGALFWVYGLMVLILVFCKKYFPRRGQEILFVFLASFLGSMYLMLIYFINPPLAMEISFLVVLVPLACIACGICGRIKNREIEEALGCALTEALILGGLIIILALIREPWGFGVFSIPGGQAGIIELFSLEDSRFFPIQVISTSAGGLLLLGYALALFHHFQNRYIGIGNRPSAESSGETLGPSGTAVKEENR